MLDAAVEVESGPLKDKAVFRREQGDYTVANAELVKLLSSPGSHPIEFHLRGYFLSLRDEQAKFIQVQLVA